MQVPPVELLIRLITDTCFSQKKVVCIVWADPWDYDLVFFMLFTSPKTEKGIKNQTNKQKHTLLIMGIVRAFHMGGDGDSK